MQDRFVGDVGDFGKYALLRALCLGLTGCVDGKPASLGDGERQLKLGVIWYYIQSSQNTPLGQTYNYILDSGTHELRLRGCDEELFEILESIVRNSRRSVAEIELSGVLSKDTVFFRDTVPRTGRDEWFKRAMDAVRDCDLVFADPDIGLAGQSDPEHATYDEAAQLWRMSKSLVIYQSFGRTGAEIEIQQHTAHLRRELGIGGPLGEIIALRFRRQPARVFFVIPNPRNSEVAQLLRDRIDAFLDCCWGTGRDPHFTRVDC